MESNFKILILLSDIWSFILPVEVGSSSPLFARFIYPRWLAGFWTINSTISRSTPQKTKIFTENQWLENDISLFFGDIRSFSSWGGGIFRYISPTQSSAPTNQLSAKSPFSQAAIAAVTLCAGAACKPSQSPEPCCKVPNDTWNPPKMGRLQASQVENTNPNEHRSTIQTLYVTSLQKFGDGVQPMATPNSKVQSFWDRTPWRGLHLVWKSSEQRIDLQPKKPDIWQVFSKTRARRLFPSKWPTKMVTLRRSCLG